MKKILSLFIFYFLFFSMLPSNASIVSSEDPNKFVGRFVFDTIPLNLKEIIDSSDKAFSGTCIEIKDIPSESISMLHVIKYTFNIDENIKGLETKKTVSFKQWKPTTADAGYEIGKKYVLFLHPNSSLDLTSPVGFLQGHFTITTDENNKKSVANKINNFGIHKNLSSRSKISLHDEKTFHHLEESGENATLIDYDEFMKAVKEMAKTQ